MPPRRKTYPPELKAELVLQMMMREKTTAQLSAEHSIHPNVLNRWKSAAIGNFEKLFLDENHDKDKGSQQHKNNEQQVEQLQAKIEQLTSQLEWVKKNQISNVPRKQRILWLEREHPDISLSTQAELLNLSRSSLYYKPDPSPKKTYIKRRIMDILAQHPNMGYRKIAGLLQQECSVHENTIYKYIKELDTKREQSTALLTQLQNHAYIV